MPKRKHAKRGMRPATEVESKVNDMVILPKIISSDEPPIKQKKWINKTRVLIFASRGVSYRARHLMKDMRALMPHSKSECKMDQKDDLSVINELCEMKNSNKCVYFEMKKKQDLYLWFSNIPDGPSARFSVENVHTMQELKMTGNCLKASRPLLSFDKEFDSLPHLQLLKELFTQIFCTPNYHPKSQPFIDHVFTFSIADHRIWFRNYQIMEEDGSLTEIGPRFVMNPIKIFDKSFEGNVLWQNPKYSSPNFQRRMLKKSLSRKYLNSIEAKKSRELRKSNDTYQFDATDDVFLTIRPEDAKGQQKDLFDRPH